MSGAAMWSRWGGKRAVTMRMVQPLRILLGGQGRFVATVPARVERLVFVCAGNICRSPFGEYLARKVGVPAISMGLHATTGSAANPSAVRHALGWGIDMGTHQATRFDAALVQDTDLVIAFELWQAKALELGLRSRSVPVRLLGGFLGPLNYHIHDPYGLSDDYFSSCFATINQAVDAMRTQLQLPHGRGPICGS